MEPPQASQRGHDRDPGCRPSDASGDFRLHDLRRDFDRELLERLYHDILASSFSADELDPLDAIADGLASDNDPMTYGVAAVDHEIAVGGVLAEHYRASNILLIAYLAVAASERGQGTGSRLLAEATRQWSAELDVTLAIAEVHDPRRYGSTEGDAATRRLGFYGRLGARIIGMPFIQPSLGPELDRVRDFLLLVLYVAPRALAGSGDAVSVDPRPLRRFIRDYYLIAEGRVPTSEDDEYRELQSHLEGPVPLLLIEELDRVPPSGF